MSQCVATKKEIFLFFEEIEHCSGEIIKSWYWAAVAFDGLVKKLGYTPSAGEPFLQQILVLLVPA